MIIRAPAGQYFRNNCSLSIPVARRECCGPAPKRDCTVVKATQIIMPTDIPALNIYGPKTLRPPGVKSPLTEANIMARMVMDVNGMSEQLI